MAKYIHQSIRKINSLEKRKVEMQNKWMEEEECTLIECIEIAGDSMRGQVITQKSTGKKGTVD